MTSRALSSRMRLLPSGSASASSVPALIASRLQEFVSPTVWHEFTPLAVSTRAVNLGQGFPGGSPPEFVLGLAASAVTDSVYSQYARSAGHLPLVEKLSHFYSSRLRRDVQPLTEVLVTVGASEGLCAFMLGVLNEGDEVVMIEPAFDIYIAQAKMCGASITFVPMRTRLVPPPSSSSSSDTLEWYIDMDELQQAFSSKTKMFLLNTPHNPTGKVFSRAELVQMGQICQDFDCILLSDEVYEHLTYDGAEHISPASLPGLWDRTVTISSAGKTFSVTGWKIGYAIGPASLISCAAIAHQWLSFSTCTPLQQAVADMITFAEKEYDGHSSFFEYLRLDYGRRRIKLMHALKNAGLTPIAPMGGFFIMADISRVRLPSLYDNDSSVSRDWNFCRWLCKEIGVCAIPPSAFCCDNDKAMYKNMARFAFCKPDSVLEEGARRLLKVRDFLV